MNSTVHPDILFLKKRLEFMLELEEYEIAAIIKRWIDELAIYYSINKRTLVK